MSHDMILDLTETTKVVFDSARKLHQVLFDNARCFVTKRSDRDFAVIYIHIDKKYYYAPLLISVALIDHDALQQLADRIPDIEPRNIMRIRCPLLWNRPGTVTESAA